MPSTPEPRQLLIVAPNWLGDAVMALPAIADLRRAFPRARVVVAARSSVAAVFDLAPGIDEGMTLDSAALRAPSTSGLTSLIAALRVRRQRKDCTTRSYSVRRTLHRARFVPAEAVQTEEHVAKLLELAATMEARLCGPVRRPWRLDHPPTRSATRVRRSGGGRGDRTATAVE